MAAASILYAKQNKYTYRIPSFNASDAGVPRYKVGYITLPATADNGDTVTIDVYKEFGMQRVLAIEGFIHSTANSIILQEAPTTTVDVNNLTITIGGETVNNQRLYVVYGV